MFFHWKIFIFSVYYKSGNGVGGRRDRFLIPEESPDSAERGVRLMADTAKQTCGKESATESIPPERSGKGEMAG